MQFTLIHTVGCTLHRHTSRVIHRSKLYANNSIHKVHRTNGYRCSLGYLPLSQRTCSPAQGQVHARQQTRDWQAKPDRFNSVKCLERNINGAGYMHTSHATLFEPCT
uniref:Uncharacterized protein n=1 Tax=Schistosoma japonicum TaxID=6182 RepID=Q5DH93_SCHJA|nr:unknown [Schistosoma japonicum]